MLVGDGNVDLGLLGNIERFFVQESLDGKFSLERGHSEFHMHFQMVIRIQKKSMVAIKRSLKGHLGETRPSHLVVWQCARSWQTRDYIHSMDF